MDKWIKISDGVEYSTDFAFFRQHQIFIMRNKNGHTFLSRLDGAVLLRSQKRDISDSAIDKLCMTIHRDICALRRGGVMVD